MYGYAVTQDLALLLGNIVNPTSRYAQAANPTHLDRYQNSTTSRADTMREKSGIRRAGFGH